MPSILLLTFSRTVCMYACGSLQLQSLYIIFTENQNLLDAVLHFPLYFSLLYAIHQSDLLFQLFNLFPSCDCPHKPLVFQFSHPCGLVLGYKDHNTFHTTVQHILIFLPCKKQKMNKPPHFVSYWQENNIPRPLIRTARSKRQELGRRKYTARGRTQSNFRKIGMVILLLDSLSKFDLTPIQELQKL